MVVSVAKGAGGVSSGDGGGGEGGREWRWRL